MGKNKLESFPDDVFLVVCSKVKVYPLQALVTKLGRKLDNDIVIQKECISREHSQIHYELGQFLIYDESSTGGTFVNNKRVNRCVLNSGDMILLADVQMMFVNNSAYLKVKEKMETKKQMVRK